MGSKGEPLLDRAKKQIDSRKGGYNGRENSFEFIRRRWVVWFMNNLGIDLDWKGFGFGAHHVAQLMVEFKIGRKEARRASGAEAHPDDDEDAAAYLQWQDMLDPDKQTEITFEATRRKVSDK